MKVLWITNYPSPYRVDFFNGLGEKCDLIVVFEEGIEKQIHRDRTWFNTNYDSFNAVFRKDGNLLKRVNGTIEIIRMALDNSYDRIVLADYTTKLSIVIAFILQFLRKRYVISIDGAFLRKSNKIREFIKRKIMSKASVVFSPSKTSDDYAIHYGASVDCIHRYPFTSLHEEDILTEQLALQDKIKNKKELNLSGEITVLLVSQFVYKKGLDFVLKMAGRISEKFQFYFIGGEPTEEYLRIVEDNNLKNVHFLGFKKKSELWKYYRASDLFLFPTRYDPWGLVVNEAMANGLPIVSTDQSSASLHFIRDDVNGFIYKVDNEDEYLRIMDRISESPECLIIMGKNNLETIKEYTIEKMVDEHIQVFSEEKR